MPKPVVTNEQLRYEVEAMEARGETPNSVDLASHFAVSRNSVKLRLRKVDWWTPDRRAAAQALGYRRAAAFSAGRAGTNEDRFWRKVARGSEDDCWLWTGSRDGKGYGLFHVAGGQERRAHRFAWTVSHSAIPHGMHVCHHCDTPSCVNPKHLFIGTNADNVRDKVAKSRQYHPDPMNNPARVLAPDDVEKIRALFASHTLTARQLARAFEISDVHVYTIVNRKSWISLT